tara:strand:- start:1211 stop:1855 length:645 start_codon:yes stop_codon:yes gene_type:complete
MKKHILYSFRRCPYAIRARWALISCNVDIEIREVDLKNKPDELLKKSKEKTVPLLLLNNGTVIDQSFNIILWALSTKNNNYLEKYYSEENRTGIRKLIKINDEIFKIHLDKFKYSSRYIDSERDIHFKKSQIIINHWNSLLKKSKGSSYWLMGEETIADWCIFPFVRQYKIACIQQKISNYFAEPIHTWLNYFENNQIFKRTMHKYSIWDENLS